MVDYDWTNPPGPFRGVRRVLEVVIVVAIVATVGAAILGGGDGLRLGIVFWILAGGSLFSAYGALWVIDNVLAFVSEEV